MSMHDKFGIEMASASSVFPGEFFRVENGAIVTNEEGELSALIVAKDSLGKEIGVLVSEAMFGNLCTHWSRARAKKDFLLAKKSDQ